MYSELNGTIFTSYVTVQGDRWDSIATRAYGKAANFLPIIQSNPGVPLNPILSAGIKLKIPVIVPVVNTTDTDKLPPWKRTISKAINDASAAAAGYLATNATNTGSYDKSFD